MKILVIEDEKLLADSIQTLLINKGFEVEVAYDGETGEEYAELGIYDLLILDVMMPKMNGYEVARKVFTKMNLETNSINMMQNIASHPFLFHLPNELQEDMIGIAVYTWRLKPNSCFIHCSQISVLRVINFPNQFKCTPCFRPAAVKRKLCHDFDRFLFCNPMFLSKYQMGF